MTAFTAAQFTGLAVRGLVRAGYPAEEILRAAAENHGNYGLSQRQQTCFFQNRKL